MQLPAQLESTRLAIVRWLYCPAPGIPTYTPIIGGKGIAELVVIFFLLVICIATAAASSAGSAGSLAETLGVILIILAMRNNFILQFIGMSFEHAILWHKSLGMAMLLVVIIHGVKEGYRDSGVALAVLIGCQLLFYIVVSKFSFNLFYYPHIISYVLILYFAFIHGADKLTLSVIIWAADLFCRLFLVGTATKAKAVALGETCTVVVVPRPGHKVRAGKYGFLMVKDINYYEFHPFSIIPGREELIFYIKNSGDWTKKLTEQAKEEMDVFFEGPYGHLQVDFANFHIYKESVFIAGGVGITAVYPVFADLVERIRSYNIKGIKLNFIWVVREKDLALDFYNRLLGPLLFQSKDIEEKSPLFSNSSENDTKIDLSIQIYLTAPRPPPEDVQSIPSHMLQAGRPDWSVLVPTWSQQTASDRVSMMVCGPMPLMDEVQGLVDRSNNTLGLYSSAGGVKQEGRQAKIDYQVERFML